MRCKGLISFVIYCVLNIAVSAVVVQILNWTDMASANGMMAVFSIFDILFAGACYVATGYILNKELKINEMAIVYIKLIILGYDYFYIE